MDCLELVESNGRMLLFVLVLIGLGGVGLHLWWSRRLTFFRFDQHDTGNKKDLTRLFLPAAIVSLAAFLLLPLALATSVGLRDCLEDPEVPGFLGGIYRAVLPMHGTPLFVPFLLYLLIANLTYWIAGLVLYVVSRRWR